MAIITFIDSNQEKISVEGKSGSVMQLALNNNIQGIDGDCGGVCSCATCHVYVSPDYFDKIGTPDEIEKDMLEFDDLTTAHSRLSCQLPVNEALDGAVLIALGLMILFLAPLAKIAAGLAIAYGVWTIWKAE